jgi:mono/diheme cytochrome c family protein
MPDARSNQLPQVTPTCAPARTYRAPGTDSVTEGGRQSQFGVTARWRSHAATGRCLFGRDSCGRRTKPHWRVRDRSVDLAHERCRSQSDCHLSQDQPGQGGIASDPVASAQSAMKMGAQVYADECSGCHATDGKGSAGLFPPLQRSAIVHQHDATSLLHVVLRGARSVATDGAPTAPGMPQFGWLLKDYEVAAVLTYIRKAGATPRRL